MIETIYFGRFLKYVVSAGGLTLTVIQQTRASRTSGFGLSDQVRLAWEPENVAVIGKQENATT